jgi:polyisoprenyl-teichoic acid--peptidoglycan teichoic acid transferase
MMDESATGRIQQPKKRGAGQNIKSRRRVTCLGLTFFVLFLLIFGGCLIASYFYTNIQEPLQAFTHPVSGGSNDPAISDESIAGRTYNILLLGSENDGKYSFPELLTQVIMVVHVDTNNNSVSLVSIPRDSWVYVPDANGMHKIDQAFYLGTKQQNHFDDGVRFARDTIESDYGITIDRYAWVGLSGFARIIDTLGGLDIDITHPVLDDAYPADTGKAANPNDPFAYQRLSLAPGPQHLNGEQALEYVRSRHADLVGDIGRTQRQQQVLEALKQQLNVNSILSNLPKFLKDLSGQFYTDLSEQEMLALAAFGRSLPSNAIYHITLGPGQGSQNFGSYSQVYDPTLREKQDVLLPNCTNIQPVIDQIFDTGLFQGGCAVNG